MYAQQAQHLHSQGVLFMNKIKDFFYNKNDIIIVLIILIAAGLIIYTRISAIMDYPETLAQQNAESPADDTGIGIKGNDCCSIQRIQCSRNC